MKNLHEAEYYQQLADNCIQCHLCHWNCKLSEGKIGVCKGKQNIHGKLYAINYGEIVSMAIDPIEKKPLYHFHPNMPIFSVAPNGCNLTCQYCQNWEISQAEIATHHFSPEDLINIAVTKKSKGIAYTYSEPLIWFEYLKNCCRLANEKGLYNVLVSNGHINPNALKELFPYINAMNLDIKSMDEKFYKQICGGDLQMVLETAKLTKKYAHLEITNLIIPDHNDSDKSIQKLVDWIALNLGEDTPLHFSRYFPRYKFSAPVTPKSILQRAWEIGQKKLWYVFVGNADINDTSNSYCHGCNNLLIERYGYRTNIRGLDEKSNCQNCGIFSGIIL